MLNSGMGYYDYEQNVYYAILGQYYKMISGRTLSERKSLYKEYKIEKI